MKAICDYCGKIIRKAPADEKKYKHLFCDRKCYFAYKKEIWVYPRSQKKNHSFFHRFSKSLGGEQ